MSVFTEHSIIQDPHRDGGKIPLVPDGWGVFHAGRFERFGARL